MGGAALVFTDIMGADGADEKALKDFTDRNATTAMARPSQYLDWLKAAGFCHVGFFDGSGHLLSYFSAMLDVCQAGRGHGRRRRAPALPRQVGRVLDRPRRDPEGQGRVCVGASPRARRGLSTESFSRNYEY